MNNEWSQPISTQICGRPAQIRYRLQGSCPVLAVFAFVDSPNCTAAIYRAGNIETFQDRDLNSVVGLFS